MSRGYSQVVVHGFLTAVGFLVAEPGLSGARGSVVVTLGLDSEAHGL